MPRIQGGRIGKRTVERLRVEDRETIFWDGDLPGFGVRVYPSGTKVYVVQSRGQGRSRRITLGRHEALSADEARRRAARIIARIKTWDEPARATAPPSITVSELAGRYLREHVAVHCKPRTRVLYEATVRRHLVPALGDTTVSAVRREQVASLHFRLRETPYAANRAVDLPRPDPRRGRGGGSPVACRREPGPVGGEVQGAPARALPLRGGVPAPGKECWTRLRRARAVRPRRPSRRSVSSSSPAAAGARSSGFAGSTSISGRAS